VKDKKSNSESDKPAVETDRYRIWHGENITNEEKKRIQQIILSVNPGERIHEVVVLDIGNGSVIKILSKERDKDGRINAFIKIERSTGKCNVMKSDEWVTMERYNGTMNLLKSLLGEDKVLVTSGEEIHAGIAYMSSRKKHKKHRGQPQGSENTTKV